MLKGGLPQLRPVTALKKKMGEQRSPKAVI